MNILEKIVSERRKTVEQLKQIVPVQAWEMMPLFDKECLSLKENLLDESLTGIIAEFKRASPSKGIINDKVDVFEVITDYELHGAAGISILTEPLFFMGNNDDILLLAESLNTPVLRKDFIVDEYQVFESKAIGADVILLIAACLTPKQVKQYATLARHLGMEVLLELHDEGELGHICDETEIVGINNRNLKTFKVDIERSLKMAEKIPAGKIKVAESGISSVGDIRLFRENGFNGFLIGENFMKVTDPGKAFRDFVNKLMN
jgi:indole-3-glycerol phosphate synthase